MRPSYLSRILLFVSCVALASAAPTGNPEQPASEDQRELVQLEHEWADALGHRDIAHSGRDDERSLAGRSLRTDTWIKGSEGWRAASSHGSLITYPEAAEQPPSQAERDEEAIRKHVADYVDAYNNHDSQAMDSLFLPDADTYLKEGRLLKGLAALHQLFITRHSTIAKTSHLTRTVEGIRFLKSDVAVVDSTYEAVGMRDEKGNPAPPLRAWITETLVKDDRKWRTVVFRAMPLSPVRSGSAPTTNDTNRAPTAAASTNAAPLADENALRTAESMFVEAVLHHDNPTLSRVLADDCIVINPGGSIRNKAEEIAFANSGVLTFESWSNKDMKVRIYGTTAVVNRLDNIKVHSQTEDRSGLYRYTNVWVKQSEQWQMVSHQVVPLKK